MNDLTSLSDTIRLSVHILAASIWVGGQVVVGSAVGALRRNHHDALNPLARSFGRVAWPAYALVVLTGMWSLAVIDVTQTSTGYQVATLIKVLVALASGAAATVHSYGSSKVAKAFGGAVASLTAVASLVLGVLIRSGV
ncbi:MAG: hypothetical protein ACO39Q_03875 [Ilumatobacteraceae bacterium]